MEHHELACLIPPMSGADFAKLKGDIASNGLMHPILLFEGKVLDGRHRLRACDELGLTPRTEAFNGDHDAALRRVISLNLHRRHLTTRQRAEIAAKLATFTKADASAKANATQGKSPGPNGHLAVGSPGLTNAEAAKLMDVSERSVRRAKQQQKPKTAEPETQNDPPKKAGTKPQTISKRVVIKPTLEQERILEAKAAEAGVTLSEVGRELVDSALAAELALPDTLAPSAKSKFDAAIAAHRRKLDLEFEARVQAKVELWLEKTRIPMYEEKIARAAKIEAAHKGVFTPEEYRKIVMTLHPDRQPTEEARTEVMALFTSKKAVLVAEAVQSSGKPLPSAAEMVAMKRKREGW